MSSFKSKANPSHDAPVFIITSEWRIALQCHKYCSFVVGIEFFCLFVATKTRAFEMVACIVHSEQMHCTHNKQTNKRIAGHRARKLIIRNAGHGKIADETNKRTKMWQLFIEFPDSSLPKRCFFVFRGWCWYQFDLFSFLQMNKQRRTVIPVYWFERIYLRISIEICF